MGNITQSKRQLSWVVDLNKCIGCQTCSVACKVLWPQEDPGTESMWWMTVNTMPGRGMPRDWETMGGGYADGELQLGRAPSRDEIGGGWDYNFDEVLRGGKRAGESQLIATDGNRNWGMNWDEDEGAVNIPILTTTTCHVCAATVPSLPVLKPVLTMLSSSGRKTGSF